MGNDSETKSLATSFSSRGSDGSTSPKTTTKLRNVQLHEKCTMEDMLNLKDAFQASPTGRMLPNEFRNTLRQVLNVEYDDAAYKLLFMKINTNRDGSIDWDEFVSHLQLGYFGNDPENQRETLQPPIMGLPTVMRSQHRHPISRICFCPDVAKDRSTDPLQGTYLTVSRDGMINWWSLDMTMLRTAFSSNPTLKVRTTWVTDMVCLPDVNIVVTSSTERDLRFYDCTARTFTLKIVISSWEFMICSMYYHFNQDMNENCMIVLGDVGGYVRLLTFSPIGRGPFRNEAGRALVMIRHKDLQRKPQLLPEMQLHEMGRAHHEWVRNVSYYASLHCVVSCATCPAALLLRDPRSSGTHNMFHVEKGVHCFAFDQEAHVLVTGGPDCTVRVWSPFVPSKPSVVFEGHHAGITCIVLQNRGQIIYSLARDRAIKVWDVQGQMCTQTYIDVPSQVGERSPISAVYNPATRDFILAAIRIAILTLDEQLNPAHTDGFTHSRAVSKVLYNPLFNVIITCGMDSIIMNWNPISGKRNVMIREAHTRLLHGAEIPVEITSGCFDPGYLLLLTGARNGSLKMWNFNTGVCLRYMSIQHMCEVTSCFWVEGRILAVGWNRHVTEFEDTGTSETGKAWELRHTDDVLTAAIRPPYTVATATYNSEMILWKLETGQPFRQFSCTDPTLRIKMTYTKRTHQPVSENTQPKQPSLLARASVCGREIVNPNLAVKKARARRVSTVTLPAHVRMMRKLAVHCAIFLTTRPLHPKIASLMVGVENGQVQGWSDHVGGGYQGTFQGIHTAGDYVSALATDDKNQFLFTGTTVGYVKVWLMTNYLTVDKVHVSMPRLRLTFPFLWRDRVEGRAKRCVRDQAQPRLLNSYRAHLRCISSLAYINEMQILLSASSDYSVRLWKLGGTYVATLGGVAPFGEQLPRDPPDVAKVASSTTLKVWHGGQVSRYVPGQVPVDKLRDITEQELAAGTFGAAPREPLLGSHFQLPRRAEAQAPPVLDDSLPTIPLYAHLRMASTQPARRPPTPELVKATRLKRTTVRKAHFNEAPAPAVAQAPAAAQALTAAQAPTAAQPPAQQPTLQLEKPAQQPPPPAS